jgi:hypothetical protein
MEPPELDMLWKQLELARAEQAAAAEEEAAAAVGAAETLAFHLAPAVPLFPTGEDDQFRDWEAMAADEYRFSGNGDARGPNIYFPKSTSGTRVGGFKATFREMSALQRAHLKIQRVSSESYLRQLQKELNAACLLYPGATETLAERAFGICFPAWTEMRKTRKTSHLKLLSFSLWYACKRDHSPLIADVAAAVGTTVFKARKGISELRLVCATVGNEPPTHILYTGSPSTRFLSSPGLQRPTWARGTCTGWDCSSRPLPASRERRRPEVSISAPTAVCTNSFTRRTLPDTSEDDAEQNGPEKD